jgi:hypothetical protein
MPFKFFLSNYFLFRYRSPVPCKFISFRAQILSSEIKQVVQVKDFLACFIKLTTLYSLTLMVDVLGIQEAGGFDIGMDHANHL